MKDYHQALYHEIFITEEYAMLKPYLSSCKTLFDIWGHIGYFSLWALKYNSHLQIHFFEPFPQLIEQAKDNLQAFSEQIVFNAFWVAKEDWEFKFLFNKEKTMQSSQCSSFLNPRWEIQKISCKNLNTYLDTHAITQIDLLKIDIEWMEYEVLSNLSPYNRKKIKNLIAEIHLLSDLDLQKWKMLKNQLSSYFLYVDFFPSPYTDRILLVFAHNSTKEW